MGSPSVARQGLGLGAARAAGQLVMVVVFAVIARMAGVERVGFVTSAVAIATFLSGLVDFGAGSFWVREYASGRLSAAEFRSRSGGKVVAGTLLATVVMVGNLFDFSPTLIVGAALLLISSVLSQTYQVVLVAAREAKSLIVLAVIERLALAFVFFLLVTLVGVAPEFAFYYGYLAGSLVFCALAARRMPMLRPSLQGLSWRSTWKGSGHFGLSKAIISLQATDVLLGATVGGPAVAGVYGAVARWTMPITLLTNSFVTMLTPNIAAAVDRKDTWRGLRGSLWLPGVTLVAAAVVLIFSKPAVLIILGKEFESSVPVLQLLVVAAALSSCAQVAISVLQARRREKVVSVALGGAVGIQLSLVVPLVHALGATGLAVAAVVGQALLCAALAGATLRILRN